MLWRLASAPSIIIVRTSCESSIAKTRLRLMVGPVAACPDGEGFKARFSDFKVKHLPDARRAEWLQRNQAK